MKGYYTQSVYMGWVPYFGKYLPFPSESEYKEYYLIFEKEQN